MNKYNQNSYERAVAKEFPEAYAFAKKHGLRGRARNFLFTVTTMEFDGERWHLLPERRSVRDTLENMTAESVISIQNVGAAALYEVQQAMIAEGWTFADNVFLPTKIARYRKRA